MNPPTVPTVPVTPVAWIGACTGVCSLLWNIYTKVTSGPRLRVTAWAGMVMMPSPPGNPRFLKITIQNTGTATTTLTNITLHQYKSRWSRLKDRAHFNAVLPNVSGPDLPHKLEAGTQWVGLVQHDDRFDKLLKDPVWCAVHHSISKRPSQVKIANPVIKPKTPNS